MSGRITGARLSEWAILIKFFNFNISSKVIFPPGITGFKPQCRTDCIKKAVPKIGTALYV